MSEDTDASEGKKVRESKKNSIPTALVDAMIEGLPTYTKASFVVVGHRGGVRVALPRTNGVSRAYFYGNGDYSLLPTHEAITVFSEEERKAQHRGGIMAEIDFGKGLEAATDALSVLVNIVRGAEAPAARGVKGPRVPRKPKANTADSAPVDAADAVNPTADD